MTWDDICLPSRIIRSICIRQSPLYDGTLDGDVLGMLEDGAPVVMGALEDGAPVGGNVM